MVNRTTRLLVATRHSPLPENDGAGAYLFDLLSYLSRHGVRVDLAWLQADGPCSNRLWWIVPRHVASVLNLHLPGAWALGRLRVFPDVWWLPFKARWMHRCKCMLQSVGLFRDRTPLAAQATTGSASSGQSTWSALPSASEADFFRRVLRHTQPDTILANYCWITPLFQFAPEARKLVLTHDVASHRLPLTGAARLETPPEFNPATVVGETALLARADAILAISAEDAAVFRQMQPNKSVIVVPKAADIRRSNAPQVRGRCLFVGGRNPPNEQGLRWFVNEVWPLVQHAVPHAHLHVCGASGSILATPPNGVVVRGRVADLSPEYDAAEVVVVPLLRGTGVKIKLVEAAGQGKACVTTPVGLQGLSFLRESLLVADSTEAFARELTRALSDASLREFLGEQIRRATLEHLSTHACYAPVQLWLQSSFDRHRVQTVRPIVAVSPTRS